MTQVPYVLAQFPADCQATQVQSLGTAGGFSGAEFWRVAAPRGTLILRRWPREHPSPERLRFIHSVLRHAADRGVGCLPLPVETNDGQTFHCYAGNLWELAPWLPGEADYSRAPSDAKLRAAMTALGQFHVATADWPAPEGVAVSTSITRRLARLHELQSGSITRLTGAVTDEAWQELVPSARRLAALLPETVAIAAHALAPLADVPLALQPVLRDVWHDHVLFVRDEVSGLVDFGALDIETPATDVARLLASLVEDDPRGWQVGIDAYTAVRPLSADERQAVGALDASGTVLAGCNWIRWLWIEGREFENRSQLAARVERIVERLGRLAQRGGPISVAAT